MPFAMFCNNKKCGQTMEPYIDIDTDKVYCSSCENEILNITHFVKVQMKSLKQYKKKQKISFSIKCSNCSKESVPKLNNNDFICNNCNKIITNISEPFKLILKDKIKNQNKD